jgi:hypothetical protein
MKPQFTPESLPDGPVTSGTCRLCNERFTSDVYRLDGWIYCGDCRYRVRHGMDPPRMPHGEDRRVVKKRIVDDEDAKGVTSFVGGRSRKVETAKRSHS